jgi:hypothetical protein
VEVDEDEQADDHPCFLIRSAAVAKIVVTPA